MNSTDERQAPGGSGRGYPVGRLRVPILLVVSLAVASLAAAILSVQLKSSTHLPTSTRGSDAISLKGFGADGPQGNARPASIVLMGSKADRVESAINALVEVSQQECHENQTVFAITRLLKGKPVWTASYQLCPAPGELQIDEGEQTRAGTCAFLQLLGTYFPKGEARGSEGAIREVCA